MLIKNICNVPGLTIWTFRDCQYNRLFIFKLWLIWPGPRGGGWWPPPPAYSASTWTASALQPLGSIPTPFVPLRGNSVITRYILCQQPTQDQFHKTIYSLLIVLIISVPRKFHASRFISVFSVFLNETKVWAEGDLIGFRLDEQAQRQGGGHVEEHAGQHPGRQPQQHPLVSLHLRRDDAEATTEVVLCPIIGLPAFLHNNGVN